ncbi:MAG: transcription-repair coupling factor [Bacteroidetes bacterium]|nr:transcription-repair coupling factor [Rhodothermia bacterium]MCX7906065.1 transcription-repair coupling factor [Bacteroidota bacterium]MDW8285877.1 transcription-repair coupling factor [Bacteroidota bacterium]
MDAIKHALERSPTAQQMLGRLGALQRELVQVRGAPGALLPALLERFYRRYRRPLWILVPSEEEARRWLIDGPTLGWELVYLPESGSRPYNPDQLPDPGSLARRCEALLALRASPAPVLLCSVAAAFERVPPPESLAVQTLRLRRGQVMGRDALLGWLREHGFARAALVREPGSFAARGGIVDVFPYTSPEPIRIEFFGDEIETLRIFDPESQRSLSFLEEVLLVPPLQEGAFSEWAPIWTYWPEPPVVVLYNPMLIEELWAIHEKTTREAFGQVAQDLRWPPFELRYVSASAFRRWSSEQSLLWAGPLQPRGAAEEFDLGAKPHPETHGELKLLRSWIEEQLQSGYRITIAAGSYLEARRLADLLGEQSERLQISPGHLSGGFVWPELGLAVLTAHEIFRRPPRLPERLQRRRRPPMRLLEELRPGDYVVHVDYGIGKFAGLTRITIQGAEYEVVRVLYHGGDVLYVPFYGLHKLQKYRAREGQEPKLTRLGSSEWETTKRRTKQRLKDITRDLIRLYAQRRAAQGYAFGPDTSWQLELEASFPFEDTPDQARATAEVKADMEKPIPMDRLVCGDVGFGKTEIAVRAAFKAVQEGKQVAVLVPTTILAHQHHRTFCERLARFPVRVEVVSRFVPSGRIKAILEDLRRGLVDILIGTHRLLSADVVFKDLGLLIIDEEQRFGVSAKEKLRQLRVNVDTLTLTATPIPRTLQLSLMGVRDLSLLTTPPPNRLPVHTEVHVTNERIIREAIRFEIGRGGQVFFVHNRVSDIAQVAAMVQRAVPEARVAIAHGQLPAQTLERVMYRFMNGEYTVLVCTNIIESGLDLPNVNTILIHNAHRFGLADLHQLRGRVGRSDRQAYCYLLVPPLATLTQEARERLQAIEAHSELGSGFEIALRDLDIRGAGNLLGAEQSGFIAEVGLEMYYRLLDEALQELRAEEFPDLPAQTSSAEPEAPEASVDLELPTHLPESYVEDPLERLRLYRRLAAVRDEAELQDIEDELRDRFGPLPEAARYLLEAIRLKRITARLGLARLSWRRRQLSLEAPPADQTDFYQGPRLEALLEGLRALGRPYRLRQKKDRLVVLLPEVHSLEELLQILRQLEPNLTLSQ